MEDSATLPFGQDSGQMSFDEYKQRPALQITSGDAAQASFSLGWEETAGGYLNRWLQTRQDADFAKGMDESFGKKQDLTPEEANKMYPEMSTKWNQPVNPYVAKLMHDRDQEKQKLQATIEAGPQDLWSKTKYVGAGFLAHAMDPIELGAGEIAGWGVGALLSRAAWGARTSAAIRMGVASPLERLAFHAAEAVPGNLIQMSALEGAGALVTHQEGMEFDPEQAMKNIAVNTFFGSVLHMGIKELAFQGSNRLSRFLNRNQPEADVMVARATVGQLQAGVVPNAEPIFSAIAKETDFTGNYSFEPFAKGEEGKRNWYVSTNPHPEFSADNARFFGEEIGQGVKMTDNPQVANAASARALSDSTGHVWEVKADALNPIDLQAPLPEDAKMAFKTAMEGVINDKTFEMAPPLEMMRKLWDSIDNGDISEARITKLQESLKEMGYNAFQNDGTKVGDYNHSAHNDITVFDHSILEPTRKWEGNSELTVQPTQVDVQKQIDYMKDPKNKMESWPQAIDEFDKKQVDQATSPLSKADDFSYVDQDVQAFQEHLESLDQQGLLDVDGQKDLAELKTIDAQGEMDRTLFKALESCTRG